MKFYKNSNNLWVVGNRIIPAGTCAINVNGSTVKIESIGDNYIYLNELYSNILKADGTAYASLAELELAIKEFSNSTDETVAGKLDSVITTLQNSAEKPALVDTSSDTVIYEGYKRGNSYLICKIDLSTAIISRTYATGAWADRTTLIYE